MIWRLIQGLGTESMPFLLMQLAAIVVVMFTALPFHEFAHAWMAKKMGDNTAQMHGRLTLDPFKHLDLMGTLMLLIVGFGFAKPVPVNPRNFRNRKQGMLFTALAGPASNLLLAVPFMLLLAGAWVLRIGSPSDFALLFFVFAQHLLRLNIILMIFNLIPIPPLDGFQIVDFFLPMRASLWISRYAQFIRWGFFALVIFGILTPIISLLANPIFGLFERGAVAIARVFV
ncbi:MAG: site-2 protease family protein [Oscillospiraceae bacterium]|nr:site-2 protease family protein [Oscillospiraceae bacterium]